MRRSAVLAGMMAVTGILAGVLAGCEGIGILVNAVAPEKVPAKYRIADRPTLVLVDDPHNTMGNSALAGVIASRIAFDLKQARAVDQIIDPQRLTAYRAEQGDAFTSLPVDRVGRDLGAQQVVYVAVEKASIGRTAPHLLEPSASARVKLIDATTGERLFPKTAAGLNEPGHEVSAKFEHTVREEATSGDSAVLMRQLADRLGREIGHVFYKHLPPQPGESFRR